MDVITWPGNTCLTLTEILKEGGEGTVYKCGSKTVAKIYKPMERTASRESKDRYLVENRPNQLTSALATWPQELLYSGSSFVGFTMRRVKNTHSLREAYEYDPISGITVKQRVVVAMNLCSAVSQGHNLPAHFVFGDMNPDNIGVNLPDCTVVCFDLDSAQITDRLGQPIHRCVVCCDGYSAPEVVRIAAKSSYADALFTRFTDYFGLAVNIFKLIFNGVHPFTGVDQAKTGSGAVATGDVNQRVLRGEYCFRPGSKPASVLLTGISPVILPQYLRILLDQAFVKGQSTPEARPNANQWFQGLQEYWREL